MPFTPTHFLAITPVAAVSRGRLPFAALAIGSMISDLPLAPGYASTHSLPGLFAACLPLGMVGFVAFEAVPKRPLIAPLPAAVHRRCAAVAGSSTAPTVCALIS